MPDDLASRFRLVLAGPPRDLGRGFRRVGLRAVLADTNRVARRVEVPGDAVAGGFTWDERDAAADRWWPQGITTSADAYGHDATSGTFEGRDVLLTSWYAHGRLARFLGSRITVVVDIDDECPAYRHVLLVEPVRVGPLHLLRPVRVHAGGIVWYGDHLFVAGSDAGIRVFRLDDITHVRNRAHARGYRYVLPQASAYTADQDADAQPMRYSFLSLDRGEAVDSLVAGEYGTKGSGSHRLVRFPLDRDTQLLRGDEDGRCTAFEVHTDQPDRMQGATLVGDTWAVTASAGEGRPGDLWVGRPGRLRRHRGVLPTGPEDVAHWPQRRQVWSLSEWPGRRWVFGVDVDPWVTPGRPGRPGPDGR